jgi:hypothetical protein
LPDTREQLMRITFWLTNGVGPVGSFIVELRGRADPAAAAALT